MRKLVVALCWAVCLPLMAQPPLLQRPTVNQKQIVFCYAGDLWSAAREGGEALRLTTGPGIETGPYFSPDGSMVAFTGEYDGNVDVFVVPASGGVPKRLTWHPGPDIAVGWTPDGKSILFRSNRTSHSVAARLFTVSLQGGLETELPLPTADDGAYSPDGSRLAYLPHAPAFQIWKRYRGGRTTPVWIASLADSRVERIPRDNSNDFNPMWIGDRIYFLSDRAGAVTIFDYDTRSKKVSQVLKNDGLDLKSATAGPGVIAYEQFGQIFLFDLKTSASKKIDIKVSADLSSVRPTYERVAARIVNSGLSPTGVRAVFEARGEIFTVPALKGDIRNLTKTAGVAERSPAWSPDGKWIAYFSDESGEYEIHLREQNGLGEVRKIPLGPNPSFYYTLDWSPDSKKLAYTDKRLSLWYVDIEKRAPVKIDADTYDTPFKEIGPSWSSDSNWIAYSKQLPNHLRAVHVFSLETGKTHQVTDGLSDARYAVFDKNGKYLYFTASTDAGPSTAWLDMSSFNRVVTRSVYVTVLSKNEPSPIAPESDEEKTDEPKKPDPPKPDAAKSATPKTVIDLEGLGQRILALPLPPRNYAGLVAGKTGVLYCLEGPPISPMLGGGSGVILQKFDLKTQKTDKVLENLRSFDMSANGEKMLYRVADRWFIASTAQPIRPGEGALNIEQMETRVNPREEWSQMYNEVWRVQRDFFYDPGLHGVRIENARRKYAAYMESVAHRADLSYLFREMLGEVSVGHMYVIGGSMPDVKRVQGGLLGADYKIENGRYRFGRVYNGENWNPQLRAPLTQPGVNVTEGQYLLSVNGRDLRASDNVYSFFEGSAGKQVVIRVGSDPGGANARDVTVVPVASESALRNLAWIEDNRRRVTQATGGKAAYVYLPNTAGAGYTNFNRYYFAQVDKQAAVIDERFNGGGTAADYIIDAMRRPLMNYWSTRDGADFTTPAQSIFGPKVMIVNEWAGSGGDAMPWYFRKLGLGPLIGKRTWGGLVGNVGAPQLIDGGFVSSPNLAFWNTKGEWEVENAGVAPDIDVDLDPAEWRRGRDTQLEKAIEVVMAALAKNPPPAPKKPAFPNYHNGK